MSITAITNVSVFDGHSLLPGLHTVLIADGKISFGEYMADMPVVDGTGCVLLPGFIDCHVHADNEAALSQFLRFGITTVLDMGSPVDVRPLRAAALSSPGKFPAYRSAGFFAAGKESHHAKMLAVSDEKLIHSVEDVEPFVAKLIADGSEFIKVIADVPGFSEDILVALAEEARNKGVTSVAHAAFKSAYERAARAGFDVVTHVPADALLDDATVEKLKEDGRVCVPTVGVMLFMIERFKLRPGGGEGVSEDTPLQNLKKLFDAGIPICVGTDANELPGISIQFGASYHDELEFMVKSGMGTTDVLKSATSEAAKRLALPDRGVVKEGLRADLVLVAGDPFQDIAATRNIKAVWIAGVEVAVK